MQNSSDRLTVDFLHKQSYIAGAERSAAKEQDIVSGVGGENGAKTRENINLSFVANSK